jgi:hypothetical protein
MSVVAFNDDVIFLTTLASTSIFVDSFAIWVGEITASGYVKSIFMYLLSHIRSTLKTYIKKRIILLFN